MKIEYIRLKHAKWWYGPLRTQQHSSFCGMKKKASLYSQAASNLSPLFCLMLGLGFVLLKPASGLDESDCLSAILRTFLEKEKKP
ncbi:hypothetical protein LDENG_00221610, partial [Lucifuga dentata]